MKNNLIFASVPRHAGKYMKGGQGCQGRWTERWTAKAMSLVRKHPKTGYSILEKVSFP